MIRRRQTPPPVLLYAELGRSQARAGEREAITWCIRSPRIWRNDNSDSDRSRPFVLNANGSRPSECRWQLREVGLWRLSRCNSSENRGRGNQTHSMAPLTAALEKNGSLWQTLDLISFELHAADQAQWVGAAQASDQRSLITPEVRGHHEVITRSSWGHHRPGAWHGPGKYLMWMITVWPGQASALRVFDYTRCGAKTGHCGDEAHELSRAVTRHQWAMNKAALIIIIKINCWYDKWHLYLLVI